MKIGDTVSVIDDNLKGIVTSVHDDHVIFRDVYGFTHRFLKDKLVVYNASIYENIDTVRKTEPAKPTSKKHRRKHLVLDLHFENMVTNPSAYNPMERLFIQKEKLVETLEFCRKNNLKKLEIIHGIGDGVLQRMVHDYLASQVGLDFDDHDFFFHQKGSVLVSLK